MKKIALIVSLTVLMILFYIGHLRFQYLQEIGREAGDIMLYDPLVKMEDMVELWSWKYSDREINILRVSAEKHLQIKKSLPK